MVGRGSHGGSHLDPDDMLTTIATVMPDPTPRGADVGYIVRSVRIERAFLASFGTVAVAIYR